MKEPRAYRMTIHLLDGVWGPSCTAYALQKTLADYADEYSTASKKAKKTFYVDDLLLTASWVKETSRLTHHSWEMLLKGGFHLTKQVSNHKEILHSVPVVEKHTGIKEVDLSKDALPTEQPLGLLWDLERYQIIVGIHSFYGVGSQAAVATGATYSKRAISGGRVRC